MIGYDPINEPQAGARYPQCAGIETSCQAFDGGQLAHFYTQMIATVRASGDRHIVWPEPANATSAGAKPFLPRFADPQVGENFHLYCQATGFAAAGSARQPSFWDTVGQVTCPPFENTGLQNQLTYSQHIGRPILDGEFSADDERMDNRRMVALFDDNFVSRMIWAYYNSDAAVPGQNPFWRHGQSGCSASRLSQALCRRLGAGPFPFNRLGHGDEPPIEDGS